MERKHYTTIAFWLASVTVFFYSVAATGVLLQPHNEVQNLHEIVLKKSREIGLNRFVTTQFDEKYGKKAPCVAATVFFNF